MCFVGKASIRWQSARRRSPKVPGGPASGIGFYLEGNVETPEEFKQEDILCLDLYFRKITLVTG